MPKLKPIYLHGEITRVDAEKREVELFCFVNERVPSQKLSLLRSAMEDATPDYMQWANVRFMHDPKTAIGVVRSCAWEPKGCRQVMHIVDDAAWEKVETGVLKGGSVGVRPEVIRGEDVTKVCWFETSLVDRPADPGAKILAFRAEGFEDVTSEEEFDVEEERSINDTTSITVEIAGELPAEVVARVTTWMQEQAAAIILGSDPKPLERGAFNDAAAEDEHYNKRASAIYKHMDTLHGVMHEISRGQTEPKVRVKMTREAMSEASDALCRAMGDGMSRSEDDNADPQSEDILQRMEALERRMAEAASPEIIERRENALIERLTAEVETLKNAPARFQPVRFTDPLRGLERTFGDEPAASQEQKRATEIQARMTEIQLRAKDPASTEQERFGLSTEFGRLKNELARVAAAAAADAVLSQ